MTSTIDLTNRTINGLIVLSRVSLSAANPRYLCRCVKCHSESTWDHSKLINAMQTARGQVARCTYSNCQLGQNVKPNKITELEPLYIGVDEASTATTEHPRFTSATLVPSKRIKSKDELLYDKVCQSRFYFDNEKISYRDFMFAKENMPRIWNRMESEIEAWQTATGGY